LEIRGLTYQGQTVVQRHRQEQSKIDVRLASNGAGLDERVGLVVGREGQRRIAC
jgi:hypothetical protein